MPNMRKLILLMVLALQSACANEYPRLDIVKPLPSELAGCRVILLPFSSDGSTPRGEDMFYKAFASELKNVAGFDIVAEGDIQKFYQRNKIYRNSTLNQEQLQAIGNDFNVQLVVLGEILVMDEVSGRVVNTEITLFVKLYDVASGLFLWDTYHKRKGAEYGKILHFGRINTITGLARRMANEIITKWTEEGMNQCIKQ